MIELNGYNFEAEILARKDLSVVRFWATWCRPCTAIKPIFDELATAVGDKARFGEVDIDEAPQLSSSLGIRSVPTIVVFKGGRPVDGLTGVAPLSVLKELVEAHIAPMTADS